MGIGGFAVQIAPGRPSSCFFELKNPCAVTGAVTGMVAQGPLGEFLKSEVCREDISSYLKGKFGKLLEHEPDWFEINKLDVGRFTRAAIERFLQSNYVDQFVRDWILVVLTAYFREFGAACAVASSVCFRCVVTQTARSCVPARLRVPVRLPVWLRNRLASTALAASVFCVPWPP